MASLVCALDLVFLFGMTTYLVIVEPVYLYYGIPKFIAGLLLLPLLSVPLTAALPILCVYTWKSGCWTVRGRLHYSLVTLSALAYIPLLNHWHLLGFCY